MHRTTSTSNGTNGGGGGLFKGGGIGIGIGKGIFSGGSSKNPTTRRPSTSGGSSSTYSEPASSSSTITRKASLSSASKSPRSYSYRGRNNSHYTLANVSPEKHRNTIQQTDISPVPVSGNWQAASLPKSADSFGQAVATAEAVQPPPSFVRDSYTSTAPYSNMLARPGTGYQAPGASGPLGFGSLQPASPTLENITYQHIQETSSKRISTLDYLRKAHEGRVYWFNTLLFNKPDLQRIPYFDPRKLARRATNYLLLGLSLPTILDLNSANPTEFLRALNALLAEFESYQQIHPPDGSSASLSRGRFPQMFKRATTTGGKGRRASSAAEIGLPMGNDSSDFKSANGNNSAGGANSATAFPISESELLPGEEYMHLLTPSLPFDPDFYETFATLCDVLIDCYTRLMSLVAGPRECSPLVAEMFTKADARVRKIIVQGVVKEFEDSSRAGVKNEVAGVGRVILGGLM